MKKFDQLKLSNQLCFPFYVLSKEIINHYRPYLDELDITYPQYIVLLVLWENDDVTVSQIGENVQLDSGTLTPLLKRLEAKELIKRKRCSEDERSVKIQLTEKGQNLKFEACLIPSKISERINLTNEELDFLKRIIHKLKK